MAALSADTVGLLVFAVGLLILVLVFTVLILAVLILGMAVLILISHDFHLPVEILQTAFPTAEKL